MVLARFVGFTFDNGSVLIKTNANEGLPIDLHYATNTVLNFVVFATY